VIARTSANLVGMDSPRIGVVTSTRHTTIWPDPELATIITGLAVRGATVGAVDWYGAHTWSDWDLLLVRSPWDLYSHIDGFHRFLTCAAAQTSMLNSAAMVAWNLDKHYLTELEAAGIAAIPTRFVEPGEVLPPQTAEFVVKPVTSGGSRNTGRFIPAEFPAAEDLVASIHAGGLAAMVQPYMHGIDRDGERALIFYNGEFSHAIRKRAVLQLGADPHADRESHPEPRPHMPSAAEMELARAAFRIMPGETPPLYARIDMTTADDGEPTIMELELTDPFFFFGVHPDAAERYCDAIMAHL
jgi:hypothetical protein